MAPSADSPSPPPSPTHRPKILVPEKVSAEGLALLRELYEVDVHTGLSPEELIDIIPGYHGRE
jgi:D-3-phosphoglycerate dehydrogenase